MRFIVPSTTNLSASSTQSLVRQARGLDDNNDSMTVSPSRGRSRILHSQTSLSRVQEDSIMTSPVKSIRNPQYDIRRDNHLEPLGVRTFGKWYESLTLEKRRALIVAMMEVCEERAKQTGGREGQATRLEDESAEGTWESQGQLPDPDDFAFHWRLVADDSTLVVQFTKWFTGLSEEEQGGALAYSAIKDGERVHDLPSKAEAQRQPRAGPSRLTREASQEVHTWAKSYAEERENRVVVPNVPGPSRRGRGLTRQETSTVFVSTTKDAASSPDALPEPPNSGMRVKLTRTGTMVCDEWGDPIFETIPEKNEEDETKEDGETNDDEETSGEGETKGEGDEDEDTEVEEGSDLGIAEALFDF